jgi:adenine phosphoribosyltransferase
MANFDEIYGEHVSQALNLIRYIPDYPAPGVLFQDITPVLASGPALSAIVQAMAQFSPDAQVIAGVEARGFILGSAIAAHRSLGFVPIRKKGKLPHEVISRSYGLEYGSDEIEVHVDAFTPYQKVLLVDDVLATGGTLIAAIELVHAAGAVVTDIALLSEISILEGRAKIHAIYPEISIHTLLS